jgi:PHD/YefM family antitoxin component YafN of YafNO toxin-antitoxin module
MYAAYHLKADERTTDGIQTLKNTFLQREIVILSKETYDEWEKDRHDAAFTEKLRTSMRELDEGKGITKTIAELETMANRLIYSVDEKQNPRIISRKGHYTK